MKPTPKPTGIVCEACGLPWADHTRGLRAGANPTLAACVKLLKQELAREKQRGAYRRFPSSQSGIFPSSSARNAAISYGTFEGYQSSAAEADD